MNKKDVMKEIEWLETSVEVSRGLQAEQKDIMSKADYDSSEYEDASRMSLAYACRTSVYEEMLKRLKKYE